MASDIIDLVQSLATLMREETGMLQTPARFGGLEEIAGAKTRLVAALDARTAELSRSDPQWMDALDPETKQQLLAALAELRDASEPNREALARQIELSVDMLAAVTAEAKRITGARHSVYGARGGLSRLEIATPISLNSQF
ncbi:MAG TPA: flagellar biosynthesis protein FlgN [Allosphingosinicella sp.]|jgi:flagellar biosynthesis/type III secretory pathway chaperone